KLVVSKRYVKIKSVSKNTRFKNGDKLIKDIINSRHTCYIYNAKGWNDCTTYEADASSDPKRGSDSTIMFDLNGKIKYETINPNNGIVSKQTSNAPVCITLAHELIHADRIMRGLQIPNNKKSHNKYITGFNRYHSPIYKDEYVPQEELATVGLLPKNNNDITENQIRKEHGLWLRGGYFS
ncbi:MAG: type III secretion system effector protein, partial [Ruminococcus sp.]|nr:type III secretion system effector protein [Ruminococcus sp.]